MNIITAVHFFDQQRSLKHCKNSLLSISWHTYHHNLQDIKLEWEYFNVTISWLNKIHRSSTYLFFLFNVKEPMLRAQVYGNHRRPRNVFQLLYIHRYYSKWMLTRRVNITLFISSLWLGLGIMNRSCYKGERQGKGLEAWQRGRTTWLNIIWLWNRCWSAKPAMSPWQQASTRKTKRVSIKKDLIVLNGFNRA